MTLLKSIVVCLVLANVGYFLWSRGIGSDGGSGQAPPAQTLQLASESDAAATPAANGMAAANGGVDTSGSAGAAAASGAETAGNVAPQQDSGSALLTHVKRCVSVGPFHDVAEAAHAVTILRAGGYDPRQRVADGDVGALYSDGEQAQSRVAQVQGLGFNPGVADRKRTGNVYWIDVDLKPTDGLLNPADLQGEAGRIVRLEVRGCPPLAGAVP